MFIITQATPVTVTPTALGDLSCVSNNGGLTWSGLEETPLVVEHLR